MLRLLLGLEAMPLLLVLKGKIVVENFYMAQKAMIFDEENTLLETFCEPFAVNGYEYEAREVNQCIREGQGKAFAIL